jgi:hypothetical protein
MGAPFSISMEDELRARGARYKRGELFQPFAMVSQDGRLVTGQKFSDQVFGKSWWKSWIKFP